MTSEVSPAELEFAATQIAKLESNRDEIQRRQMRARRTALWSGATAEVLKLVVCGRRLAERHRFWREGAVLLGPLFVAAGSFIVADYCTGWRLPSIFFGLLAGAVSVGGFYALFFQPETATVIDLLQSAAARRVKALEELQHLAEHAATTAADLLSWWSRLADLKIILAREELKRNHEFQLRQLFRRDWKSLRSVEFETFLEEVLLLQGYKVETTKITGDQGVDLVVSKDDVRIAIQVKGYTHAVGNAAVQQAFAGQAHYQCQACAVITNSRFTPGAVELAKSTRCLLVGEAEFEAFVLGKMDLIRETVGRR